jgi:membrane-associated protease RseP (regulator of RpoE activity)
MRNVFKPMLLISAMLIFAAPALWAGDDETPFLGINPGELTSDIAMDYGVKAGEGILIEGVIPETPAAEAGFRTNDVITKLNGALITGPAELRTQLKKYKPGETVNITYFRGGIEKVVAVKLGKQEYEASTFDKKIKIYGDKGQLNMDGPPWEWKWEGKTGKRKTVAFAGVVTQALSEGLAEYFKVKEGALISEVVKDSPADKAGLKAGDVIIKIGDESIEDEGDVADAIHEFKPGDAVDFIVYRDGKEMTIKVTLGETTRFGSLLEKDIKCEIEDGMVRIHVPEEAELEKLAKDLDQLELQINPPAVPAVPAMPAIPSHSVVTISHNYDRWQESFDRLRNRLNETFVRLREQIEFLKVELHDLALQLRLTTA